MEPKYLTPRMVLKLLPDVTLSWIYKRWDSWGGFKDGGRKFIKEDVFYANFEKEGLVLCKNNGGRGDLHSIQSRDRTKKMQNPKRGQDARNQIAGKSPRDQRDENRFGLLDCLESLS
ncbi:hypothetical protein [Desulfobacter postgatei]|uniref:hypothetical protein n=1 Tax=Desulfobacter postgatei TaxID=2293 RepID=UPI002A362B80|nr:hypothetical protein [Desulfobacter postgatei]MDX9963624.1 hypothetical protein [Desulfobacter postgatei]